MTGIQYRPAIDGLRAIAVMAVILFHMDRRLLPGGFVGVDVFFVISGFLISSILLREIASGTFQISAFYQRRIARILPAFSLMAAATVLAACFVYSPQDLASTGATFSAAVLSVANMKLMTQGSYFELSPDAQPFLHCWSLSVEEQFYLLFPVVLIFIFRYFRGGVNGVLWVFFLVSFGSCLWLTRLNPQRAFFWLLMSLCG